MKRSNSTPIGGDLFDWSPDSTSPDPVQQGDQKRDKGMQRAADHADRVEDSWTDRAFACLVLFPPDSDEFMAEDVRQWAEEEGNLPPPPDARAWGSVLTRAKKAGLIEWTGYGRSRVPSNHRGPRSTWRKIHP